MGGRNPVIDVLKLVFAFMVMHYHMRSEDLCGYLAVDFFFIVSGYLLISHCRRKQAQGENESIWRFCVHKYMSFLPYLIVAEIFAAMVYGGIQFNVGNWDKGVGYIIRSIENMTCLSMTGLFESDTTWYLSAMMLSSVVLYALVKHGGRGASRYVIPALSLMALLFVLSTGQINEADKQVFGRLCKGLFRGFADMGLGVLAYTVVEDLRKKEYSERDRLLFSLYGALCYAVVFVLIFLKVPMVGNRELMEFLIVVTMVIGVTITMSRIGSVHGWVSKVPFLTEYSDKIALLSLLVYLNHWYVVHLVRNRTKDWQFDTGDIVISVVGTLVMCVVCYYLGKIINSFIQGVGEGIMEKV